MNIDYAKNIIKLAFPRGIFYKGPASIQASELCEALMLGRKEIYSNNLPQIVEWAYQRSKQKND